MLDKLDEWVWNEAKALLQDPTRIEQEYQRRLVQPDPAHEDLNTIQAQLGKLRQGIARLIDSYTEGFIDKQEFEPRIKRLKGRLRLKTRIVKSSQKQPARPNCA